MDPEACLTIRKDTMRGTVEEYNKRVNRPDVKIVVTKVENCVFTEILNTGLIAAKRETTEKDGTISIEYLIVD